MTISVSLRLAGDELLPQEITSLLGLGPTTSRIKGKIRISSTKKEIFEKTGAWVWKLSDFKDGLGLLEQIEKLSATFHSEKFDLKKLPGVEHAWIDVCIVSDAPSRASSTVELLLDVRSIKSLYALGLPVEITVYPS